jgi:hypothetical protein
VGVVDFQNAFANQLGAVFELLFFADEAYLLSVVFMD